MNRVLRRATTMVAALALGVACAVPATANETGLSGTVTDEAGTPVAACVSVYDEGYDWVDAACTEDGAWNLPDVPDGTYRVRVDGQGTHLGEWAHDATDFWDATPVSAPGTVDVALTLGGVLTGTLTDADGNPVVDASVTASTAEVEEPVEYASTDADGTWSMVVRPGAYKVQMSTWAAVLWAFGASSHATATTLDVAPGATVRVDDHFKPAAKVAGRITEAKTKRPVEGACATLLPLAGDESGQEFGRGCADATGAYELTAWAEGSFLVLFTDPSGRFAAEYLGGTTSPRQARAVTVVGGRTVQASAVLDIGAELVGRVVDAGTGAPIPDVCPSAHIGRTWAYVPGQVSSCTGENGTYRIGGLPADPTTLMLSPPWKSGLAQTWYLGATDLASATLLRPRAGRITTLADTRLTPGGTVSGQVTDGLGNPVQGVHVNLMGNYGGRSGGCENPLCGYTDENGFYEIKAPAGTYRPFFWSYDGGWAPEWSGDSSTRAAAAPVTVTSGGQTSLDAQLDQGGVVTGSVVTATGGRPSFYVLGTIWTEAGDYIGDFDAYDGSDFTFRSSALPAGRFRLVADLYDGTSGSSTRVWYDGSTTEAGATLVPLSLGEQLDITFHLP